MLQNGQGRSTAGCGASLSRLMLSNKMGADRRDTLMAWLQTRADARARIRLRRTPGGSADSGPAQGGIGARRRVRAGNRSSGRSARTRTEPHTHRLHRRQQRRGAGGDCLCQRAAIRGGGASGRQRCALAFSGNGDFRGWGWRRINAWSPIPSDSWTSPHLKS